MTLAEDTLLVGDLCEAGWKVLHALKLEGARRFERIVQPRIVGAVNLDQNAPRKLLVQPGRDGDEWTVRIDDFNVFGTGASREAAFDNLAAAVRRMFDAGALASASPVTAKQLRQERRLHSWFWAALKKRPLAQVDYTTLQSLLDRAS